MIGRKHSPREWFVGTFRHLPRAWIEELTNGFVLLDFVELDVTTMNGHPAKGFQYWGRKG